MASRVCVQQRMPRRGRLSPSERMLVNGATSARHPRAR
jgi:hypothetical protein